MTCRLSLDALTPTATRNVPSRRKLYIRLMRSLNTCLPIRLLGMARSGRRDGRVGKLNVSRYDVSVWLLSSSPNPFSSPESPFPHSLLLSVAVGRSVSQGRQWPCRFTSREGGGEELRCHLSLARSPHVFLPPEVQSSKKSVECREEDSLFIR